MCKDAAKVLMMQCGREYGFDDEDKDLRATLISSIEESKLDKLPTNNLICERAFSVFDRRARVAASGRNRNFQGHGLRDDMVLYDQSTESLISRVDKVTGKVEKILKERETEWTSAQRNLVKDRVKKKHQLQANKKMYQVNI